MEKKLSPMMQQYFRIKEENPDCILFFRLGDFYEMFFEDAKIASEELELVLTGKDCGLEERAPMCGVPFHSVETYIGRLVERGYKIAICEQTEDPSKAKGLVNREVIRIVTPGTLIEDTLLEEGKNNYLCAVSSNDGAVGLCFADVSTGETSLTEIDGENVDIRVINEIGRFNPSEVLMCEKDNQNSEIVSFIKSQENVTLTLCKPSAFDFGITENSILNVFGVISVENLGVQTNSVSATALGAVINYLCETGINCNFTANRVNFYRENQRMRLDITAIRNLEIVETMRSKSRKGSLLWVLDKTKTAMGKRLMRSVIEQPLLDRFAIESRLNAVEELFLDTVLRGECIDSLTGVRDIERIMTKVVYGTGSARELNSLRDTLEKLPRIKETVSGAKSRLLKSVCDDIDLLTEIKELISSAITEEPPALVREGGMIKAGYNAEVDELRYMIEHGTELITGLESRERERTGIKTLKIKYNRVFGYFIEVTNSFLDKIPDDYIRRQTMTGAERFITDELKDLESKVLGAKERIVGLEYELFDEVRRRTAAELKRFQQTASALARLDVMCSLSAVAVNNNYCRPRLNDDGTLLIKSGRHPVVEQLTNTPFVANDTYLNANDERCAIITGPNMAGKSTYMRQVAIITVMAQIGSFVPAESANISICDAVFTRVGASDDLASGQSTFMVEMSEVASILKNATKNSLLILDEIGRGTSTYDGMSIAKAVLEFVTDKRKLGAKTLFATHYHELTDMEREIKGIKNYNIAVKKRGDDIIFLRRIIPGGADDSYGVEVAKLAGIPKTVTNRAKEILKDIESNGIVKYQTVSDDSIQLPIEIQSAKEIFEELKILDVNTLTPIESMGILFDLANKAKSI